MHFPSYTPVDRDSAVGRYRLDGPGSIPGEDEIFRTRPNCLRPHSAFYIMGTGPFQGVKWPGRDFDHLPHLSAEV
jgi:hypothetical protein